MNVHTVYRTAIYLAVAAALLVCGSFAAARAEDTETPDDEFVTLGTVQGIGGKDFMEFDRNQIKYQIKQFIPPLLRPAFAGHAFVLPPRALSVSASSRFATIGGSDFFMNGNPNRAVSGRDQSVRVRPGKGDTLPPAPHPRPGSST